MDDSTNYDEEFLRVPSIGDFASIPSIPSIPEAIEDPPTPNQTPRMSLTTSFTCVPLRDEQVGRSSIASTDDGDDDGDDGDDIEALAAKACALASVPIPDYADAFARKNKKYRTKKYRDKVQSRRSRRDKDPNSIVLANKTSSILSEFQDYLSVVETEPPGSDILEYTYVGEVTSPTDGNESERGAIAREWKYDEGPAKRRASSDRNLWASADDDDNFDDCGSTYSSSKERRRYWHTTLLSKKFKIGLVWVIVSCVLVGIIIGIASSGGKIEENTEEELLERVEGIKVEPQKKNEDLVPAKPLQTQNDGGIKSSHNDEEPKSKPDGNGVEAKTIGLPTNEDSVPPKPLIRPKETVNNQGADELLNEDKWFSRATGWSGSTYVESIDFCFSQNMALCPYEAYCGAHRAMYPSTMMISDEESKEQWAPVSNDVNEWVQIGPYDTCTLYRDKYTEQPDWGVVNGEGGELITEHIKCCTVNEPDKRDEGDHSPSQQLAPPTKEPDDPPVVSEEQEPDDATVVSEEHDVMPAVETETPKLTKQDMLAYEASAKKYSPREFDRKTGWTGSTHAEASAFCGALQGCYNICSFDEICPLGHDTQPLGGYRQGTDGLSWAPVRAEGGGWTNDWVQLSNTNACTKYSNEYPSPPEWDEGADMTSTIMCCISIEAELETNQPNAFDRNSGWGGQTYYGAIKFCGSLNQRLCDYNAICPMGPETEPLFGYKESDGGGSWAPISDGPNDWVSLSSDNNACSKFSSAISEGPEWGETGEGNESMTRNIMCCEGSVVGSPEETYIYEHAIKKYHPVRYHRATGWGGQTYDEAVNFCEQQSDEKTKMKMSLCPYEAYCPMDMLDIPVGGVVDEPNGSWAPLGEISNGWISVGAKNTCKMYQVVNGGHPEWGLTGNGNEEITRHIMCCAAEDEGVAVESQHVAGTSKIPGVAASPFSPAPTSSPSKKTTPPPTPLPSNQPTPPPTPLPSNSPFSASEAATVAEAYKAAVKYNPVWYDRSSGWTGQTYDEAFSFCNRKGPDYDICPYEVICPAGQHNMPYGGARTDQTSWAPINHPFNSWVQVSNSQVCVQYDHVYTRPPEWGLTGVDNEELTRHIMCCKMDNLVGETPVSNEKSVDYSAVWYHRGEGRGSWVGKSYTDAIAFCAMKDSSIPCPYEAICPNGPGSTPTDGSRQAAARQAWAPIMDAPNGWVSVSSYDSCELYNSIHSHPPIWGLIGRHGEEDSSSTVDVKEITADIMCCNEPPEGYKTTALWSPLSDPVPTANTNYEQEILNKKHPLWFGRKHGYNGNTHEEAADFCKSIGDRVLCPREAYCPEGAEKPLFLQKDAFEGEQWAPVATMDYGASHKWILVGTLDGESQSTCATLNEVKGMKPSGWNVGDANPLVKEHVMCCQNPVHLLKEMNFVKELDPVWLDETFGWKGGSHDDANVLCSKLGNKKLCPYTAYCPHGPGQPVVGGHAQDFNSAGEIWAPVYSHNEIKNWVMIGQKYQNFATTCMDTFELEGHEPSWGMSNERADLKTHIMCCSF